MRLETATAPFVAPPAIVNRYVTALAALGIRMPLRHDETHCGTIVDADGKMVCVVDIHGEQPDADVRDIAALLLLAINVHAGHLPDGR